MAAYRESTRGEEYQIESLQCACHDCPKRQIGEDFYYFYKKANIQQVNTQEGQSLNIITQSEPLTNYIGIICGPCNKKLQVRVGRAIANFRTEFNQNQKYQITFNRSGSEQEEVPPCGKIIRSKIYCSDCRTSEQLIKDADEKIKAYASHGRETSLQAAKYFAEQQFQADQEQLRALQSQLNQQGISQMKKCLILNKIQQILRRYQTPEGH